MDISKEYISASEAANILQVTTQYVRELVRTEIISGQKIGSQWIISRKSLFDYIDNMF